MKKLIIALSILICSQYGCKTQHQADIIPLKVGPQPDGSYLVPSNQFLRPAGLQLQLPGRPVDIALTQDGKYLIVKNIADIDMVRLSDRTILQSLPYPKGGSSFTGICLSPDGKNIYVTDNDNKILIAEINENRRRRFTIPRRPCAY